MKVKNIKYLLLITIAFSYLGCENTTTNTENQPSDIPVTNQLEWTKDKTIYEVNLRQYSPSGSFEALTNDLERIKEMGIDIIWLMPIHPISTVKRKGTLGSYYAVADYKDVNPEHGTLEDFKKLTDKIHELGMYTIIDWVPNHTGWDNHWITEHSDYYTKNDKGEIIDPINTETGESWGWTDVADLNYDNPEMRAAMIDAMKFWMTDYGVDGFRCDVAHGVPQYFWEDCIKELKTVDENVFMLAEAEIDSLRNQADFEMTYAWNFKNVIVGIADGDSTTSSIDRYLAADRKKFQKGYHMYFTSNHDENTWHGNVFKRFGDGHKAFAVLCATFDGMPLVYSGQEAPMKKDLKFFEKDTIDWNGYAYADFYKSLLTLKKRNQALWNGGYGGEPVKIKTGNDDNTYAFLREKNEDKILVILNLSNQRQDITLGGKNYTGEYKDVFNQLTVIIEEHQELSLEPWDYIVLSNK